MSCGLDIVDLGFGNVADGVRVLTVGTGTRVDGLDLVP